MRTFETNLKSLRKQRGLSLQELAKRLNDKYDVKFSKTSIDRWEKGESNPTITQAAAIAHYFDVSLDDLSGLNDLKAQRPNTIAAHLEDENYTEDEINQILQIAEIVRNKNK